jgi:hypothetical protein
VAGGVSGVSEEIAAPLRRRHKRSWLRRNRTKVYLAMMVLGGGLVCGGFVVLLTERAG